MNMQNETNHVTDEHFLTSEKMSKGNAAMKLAVVTDEHLCADAKMLKRNAVEEQDTVTEEQSVSGNTLSNGNAVTLEQYLAARMEQSRDAEMKRRETRRREWQAEKQGGICGGCFRQLEPGETVWRFNYGAPRAGCCARGRDYRYWCPEQPCQGCGRGVVYQRNARHRRHVFCSQRCEGVWRWRQVKEKRAEPSACLSCGNVIAEKRTDAKHCSPKCKQRAYRQRKATG